MASAREPLSSPLSLSRSPLSLSYWAFNYPADVIKSAMQGDAIKRSERQYKGFVDAARQLYAQGGMPRFFRGYAPCMLRAFPANAACFFAYEKTKHMLS